MFVGITSLVTAKDAVEGQTMGSSTQTDPIKAAVQIARVLGLSGKITVTAHGSKAYQHNVAVDGKLAFRLLDIESTPRQKVPSAFRPASTRVTAEVAEQPAPRRVGRPRKTVVAAEVAEPVKRGRGRPKGSKNKPKVAANTRTVANGTTRKPRA